jgi:hypothetical protein
VEAAENNGATVDQQTEAKSPVGEEMHPPIRKDSDETEWKIVVPKGRRSYTKNVMNRKKGVETHFLAQNKFVKVCNKIHYYTRYTFSSSPPEGASIATV